MNRSRFLVGAALLTVASIPSVAFAQSADPADANGNGIPDAEESITSANATSSEEGIVITGSRIRRTQYNTADSIQVITREGSTQAGFDSTSEVLQSAAVTNGTSQINDQYGGFVVNGGPGANTISLRGLGTTRSLVLLNGRRIAPAGTRGSVGAADLNTLPNAVVERFEVLNTGASSIYGSDAVAGVINIVTRRDVEGIELEAQHNVLEAGAGNSYRYSLVGGFSSERWKFTGAIEYFRREVLEIGDREFALCPRTLYGTNGTDFGAGDFIDPATGQPKCFPLENGGVTVNTIGTPNRAGGTVALAPGVPTGYTGTCNRFRPRTGAAGGVPGYECVGGGSLSLNIRDTFSPSLLKEDLYSPVTTYTAFGQTSYELEALGDAELYGEVLFSRRKSSQDGQRQFTLDYPLGSPLIPAELRFPTAIGAATPTTNGLPIGIRVFADYGIYNNRQEVDYTRAVAGIRGNFLSDWRYDVSAMKSWSDGEYTSDLILIDRLAASFDVVAAGSGFACRNPIAGCVAAPALTPAVVGGQFPAAWFDFVTDPVTGTTKYNETTFSANVDGPLFSLPGGKAQLVLGVEYRKTFINDVPAPDSQRNNLYGFTSSTITTGSDAVKEVYGEIELPLIRDGFIKELTLNASGRYTEYDSYGGQWTYKLGGLFSPINGVSFRGSYGTSFRAPALFEQFLGRTSGFLGSTTDPCNDVAAITNPLIRTQCLADGLAPDFIQRNGVTSITLGGAEAGLSAETSRAITFGAVVEPKLGGFGDVSLAVDYFDVKVDNGISRLTAGSVLAQCYNNPDRTTCRPELISRDANGVLTVVSSYVNISDSQAKGVDFNLRYSNDVFGGKFRLDLAATRFIRLYGRTFPTDPITNTVGLIPVPKWSGTADAVYSRDNWSFRYRVEWLGGTDSTAYAEPFGYDPNEYLLKTDDYFVHTASVSLDVTSRFGITLGVTNLFDTDPPVISADYTNLTGNAPLFSGYDVRGRQFFMVGSVKF